jgi:hypothetical protein
MKLKVGDLVYLKNVGFPYNRSDDGHESFEGASCVILSVNAGARKDMIDVRFLFPMRVDHGKMMNDCLFFPECVIKENRPWLKKHVRRIINFKKQIVKMKYICTSMAEDEI